ncbi:MAG: 50S ribosomal protein L11 methyltransferase [Clostridia bacterium]|nr:50S ribosomal protein L11 methyltransferase [Clostridia bacterium]
MAKLFGTDGVRGIANQDLSCELAMKIGMAGAQVLTSEVRHPRILIGRDTRRSGDMLSSAIAAGICAVGGDVVDLGVIPTPAMAYLVRLYAADAAVMVSASHNTMEYNGIKWFNGDGFKLSDTLEEEIEHMIEQGCSFQRPLGEDVGHVITAKRAREEYKEFLKSTATESFEGLTVVLDCANGASSGIASEVFLDLGAKVISRADEPNGSNINDGCGSTHPELLQDLAAAFQAEGGNELPRHKTELVEDKDWVRAWMDDYHPMPFGQRLWVCPSWREPPQPDAVNLLLDPGLAFGTGTHPTTALCLRYLDREVQGNELVVDYGCGRGILGIAALLLGAKHMVGVDIDPQALTATRDNAGRNGIADDRYEIYLPADTPAVQGDITVANILAGPLTELGPHIAGLTRQGGKLALSGLLAEQAEEVSACYSQWFDMAPAQQQDDWVILTGIKR